MPIDQLRRLEVQQYRREGLARARYTAQRSYRMSRKEDWKLSYESMKRYQAYASENDPTISHNGDTVYIPSELYDKLMTMVSILRVVKCASFFSDDFNFTFYHMGLGMGFKCIAENRDGAVKIRADAMTKKESKKRAAEEIWSMMDSGNEGGASSAISKTIGIVDVKQIHSVASVQQSSINYLQTMTPKVMLPIPSSNENLASEGLVEGGAEEYSDAHIIEMKTKTNHGASDEPEKRLDENGVGYALEEFLEFYGEDGKKRWENATPVRVKKNLHFSSSIDSTHEEEKSKVLSANGRMDEVAALKNENAALKDENAALKAKCKKLSAEMAHIMELIDSVRVGLLK
eukprot:CAMPEP_0167741706 /NCGR_PEP_ID=MMETSP0110_2-20121227/1005_1 /TAXON_ID=629695 /ORGANISM="Gymnochlora sp., Strain CCMP2014" /LENGTH=344 /DNA_ID=CAMNT_0007625787 /DNA_START=8 /DNA_END=1042 /DNA_ORIENTATION=-